MIMKNKEELGALEALPEINNVRSKTDFLYSDIDYKLYCEEMEFLFGKKKSK